MCFFYWKKRMLCSAYYF